jgi:histidinol phosphatase-like PHP family hydrolase
VSAPRQPRNDEIAELLAVEAEEREGHVRRAYRRASRRAFTWPVEAAELVRAGGSLTELAGIGPFLARRIRAWLEEPPWVPEPPEIRRDFLTVPAAARILGAEPDRRAARADLQMHTTWSDGTASVEEMARAAAARGRTHVAVTDHSRTLRIAGGIDEAELDAQGREIAAVNRALEAEGTAVRVLRSVELNLSPAGEGDLEPAALGRLDLVLGSFHSALRRTEDQTPRYLAALRNPHVHVIGHPRGRIYDHRVGLRADWRAVCAEAASLDKALEIDAYPDRQDLNVELLEEARAAGTRISIGTDAHTPGELAYLDLGLAAAAAARIPRQRILNYLETDELLAWAERIRLGGRAKRVRVPPARGRGSAGRGGGAPERGGSARPRPGRAAPGARGKGRAGSGAARGRGRGARWTRARGVRGGGGGGGI